jgi:peptidoglycan/LPS O-acetylase OafA/YrhL
VVLLLGLAETILRFLHLVSPNFHFLLYLGMFVIGIVLANHRNELQKWVNSRSMLGYVALLVVILICLRLSLLNIGLYTFADLAAVALITLSLGENHVSRFLRMTIPQFLGHISYSTYLIHLPLLLFVLHAFHGTVPLSWLLVPTFCVTILVSAIFYRVVEQPSMDTGRKIARWIKSRRLVST